MTYANAVLPHALFVAAQRWPQRRTSSTSRRHRLPSSTARRPPRTSSGRSGTRVGIPAERKRRPTISSRWKPPRWPKPRWRPWICSADEKYLATFHRAHAWFHGHNSLHRPLVDVASGACCDGLAAVRRESEPRGGIDARLLVDRNQQYGTSATIQDSPGDASASLGVSLNRQQKILLMEIVLNRESQNSAGRPRHAPSAGSLELFHRHADNPILTAQDWPYPAHTVFNAGACQVRR